jgi:type IV secretion system protein TrbL
MAERVLGNVVSSGIKVLVLAVIIGIGSTLFAEFTAAIGGAEPTIEDAMTIVLAALAMLGLGIFGPGIASGIVSGGPQLGAGAAAGTALAAGGLAAGGIAGAKLAAGAATSAASGIAHSGAKAAGGGAMAYSLGSAGKSGASGIGAVGQAAAGAATSPLRKAADSMKSSFKDGARRAITATGGTITGGAPSSQEPDASSGSAQPAWAKAMKNRQTLSHSATVAAHTLRSGDGGGAGSSIDVTEKD